MLLWLLRGWSLLGLLLGGLRLRERLLGDLWPLSGGGLLPDVLPLMLLLRMRPLPTGSWDTRELGTARSLSQQGCSS